MFSMRAPRKSESDVSSPHQVRRWWVWMGKEGGGWVVLALLESPRTKKSVAAELKGAAAALGKLSAAGCRSLADALKKK